MYVCLSKLIKIQLHLKMGCYLVLTLLVSAPFPSTQIQMKIMFTIIYLYCYFTVFNCIIRYSIIYLKLCVLNCFYMLMYIWYVMYCDIGCSPLGQCKHRISHLSAYKSVMLLLQPPCCTFFKTIKALCHHHVTLTGPRQFSPNTKGQKVIDSIHF